MTLATIDDYEVRHGAAEDAAQTTRLLEDAASLIRSVARIHISRVEDDEVLLDGDGSRRIFLPNIPVEAVSAVEVDAVLLDSDAYRWWAWGGLDRRDGRCWPCEPGIVAVTYTHGTSAVEPWIVNLNCAMVQRATRDSVVTAVQQETTGSQSVMYAGGVTLAAGGVTLWLTENEVGRVEALRGPVLA